MSPRTDLSPAMEILMLAWEHQFQAAPRHEGRAHDGMQRVLRTCIEMGLRFDAEDFARLNTRGYPHVALSIDTGTNYGEGYYMLAIHCRHTSACRSFEHARGRTPFFWQGTRLHLHAALDWRDRRGNFQGTLYVTSFDDQAGTVTACAYEKTGWRGWMGLQFSAGDGKPCRRYTLTHADLRAAAREGLSASNALASGRNV